MTTNKDTCVLAAKCKMAGVEGVCNNLCSPFIVTHGGNGGYWKATNTPPKYRNSFISNLPIDEENPVAAKIIRRYSENVIRNVRNGVGLFFYPIVSNENPMGTGTGKTTSAIAILHEYLIARIIEQEKGGEPIKGNPALFYKASELQTLYNAQFKGTFEMQERASMNYYTIKRLLMSSELVVLDDIGIRQKITDAFENELTEIIDARDSKMLATIFTSNLPLTKLTETVGERIASRIEGMTELIAFKGKDNRRGGIL